MKEYKSKLEKIRLVKDKTDFQRVKIGSSKDAADYIRQFYHGDIEIMESFFLLLLNNSNNTIGYVKISTGGITGTLVDVRIVAKYCIESLSPACIVAHNHPSGKTEPSRADTKITEKLRDALALLDVKLLDHVIVTTDDYYSFADETNIL